MKNCLNCTKEIGPRRKYCSNRCRGRVYYLADAAKLKAAAKKQYYAKYEAYKAQRSTPVSRYQRQQRRAVERGIAWLFTFESWIGWWGADYATRGRTGKELVMARYGDIGPYSPFNCYKTTIGENTAYAVRQRNAA